MSAACGDLVEHRGHQPGRAAVQRAREGAVGADHRGGERGARRGDDPRRERGGAEPVVDQRDEIGVERRDGFGPRRLAGHHAQEIGRGAERRVGRDRGRAARTPQQRRDHHREGAGDHGRRAVVGQRRERDPQALAGRAPGGGIAPRVERRECVLAPRRKVGADAGGGQLLADKSLPQDRDRALVAVAGRQVLEPVSPDPDLAARAVRMAEHGLGGDEFGEPAVHGWDSTMRLDAVILDDDEHASIRAALRDFVFCFDQRHGCLDPLGRLRLAALERDTTEPAKSGTGASRNAWCDLLEIPVAAHQNGAIFLADGCDQLVRRTQWVGCRAPTERCRPGRETHLRPSPEHCDPRAGAGWA